MRRVQISIKNEDQTPLVSAEAIEQRYKQVVLSSNQLEFHVTEDIKNANGAIILKSGKEVEQDTYEKILQHKLLKPLDEYLHFVNQVTPQSIVDDIILIGEQALSDTTFDFSDTLISVKQVVKELQYDKTVLNKLTVYKYDNPDKFDHSLATALISTEIGKALNFSLNELEELFSVCLFHDLGEMHIEKSIYLKEQFDEQDYKAIKVHPIISYLLLKESQTSFSEHVLQAVLNHHERLDKSGYPRGLGEKNINHYARILALVDTYDALRRKGRSAVDAMWAVKMQGAGRSISGDSIMPAYEPRLIKVLDSLIRCDTSQTLNELDVSFMQQQHQLKNMLSTLNSINDDVVHLWDRIMIFLQDDTEQQCHKTMERARQDLHKVKDLILASSGVVGVDVEILAARESELKETCKDVCRMAPELKSQLARINSVLNSLQKQASNARLSELLALNNSACQKSGDLYRTAIFNNSVH